MIFIDLETTDLLKPDAVDIDQQPHITEICLIKTDKDFKVINTLDELINPTIPIPDYISKITNIYDDMVEKKPLFINFYDDIVDMFIGERQVVGHNVTFDLGVLYVELARCGLEFKFPWPPEWICTVEKAMYIEKKRLKLSKLYSYATGKELLKQHRAKEDTETLITCYKWLCDENN